MNPVIKHLFCGLAFFNEPFVYNSVSSSVHVGAAVLTSFVAAARERWPVERTASVTMRNVAIWRTAAAWLVEYVLLKSQGGCLFTLWMAISWSYFFWYCPQDLTEISDVSKETAAIPEDPTAVSPRDATFFRPPSVPPTKKVRPRVKWFCLWPFLFLKE